MDGIGWFTYEVFSRLVKKHPECEFHFIFDRAWSEQFMFGDNVVPHKIGPQARHPILFYLWFDRRLPKLVKKIDPDLFVSPDGFIPRNLDCKVLNVLHDINFHHNPNDFGWMVRNYYNHFVPQFAQIADRLATVSEFCKADIASAYDIDSSKIDVVYNGVNERYQPVSETQKAQTRKRFTETCPYILFLGTIVPRKNLKNLLIAFDLFKETDNAKHKLLVVGSKKYWTPELEKVYASMQHKSEVIFLGYRMPEELALITASAKVLAFISYFEGFGIPILEAMKCGVPVLSANRTATKEIAGDAAFLVDPFNLQEIREGLVRLTTDPNLRDELVEAGFVRASSFNWDKTASDLWDSMMKTIA